MMRNPFARATSRNSATAGVAAALFLCLFAAQSALIAVAPALARIAADLGVSTAAAGQLRTIAGVAAGATALALGAGVLKLGTRRLLLAGCTLVAVGSAVSAAAPSFTVLALAQVAVGGGIAVLVSTSLAAVAEWAPPDQRARVLSCALIGQPAAWIVGMPALGALGEIGWRYGWLALPLVAALLAAGAVHRRPETAPAPVATPRGLRSALADERVARWAAGELLANAAWAGVVVYAGALFVDSYAVSLTMTGAVLAVGAGAYVAGNLTARRLIRKDFEPLLVRLSLLLALVAVAFGAVRPGLELSAALFALAGFMCGARTLVSSAFGFQVAPEHRFAVTSARAAANQFGYFVGAAGGGVALGASGYGAWGIALGCLFAGAALPLCLRLPRFGRVLALRPSQRSVR